MTDAPIKFTMPDGGDLYVRPSAVLAVAPAHQQGKLGGSFPVGSMLIFAGGVNLPIKGFPGDVAQLLFGNDLVTPSS